MDQSLRNWIIAAAASILLVPVAVFLGGWLLVGPYEGEAGLLGLTLAIYRDALLLDGGAWLLLLAPVLLAALWTSCRRLSRRAA